MAKTFVGRDGKEYSLDALKDASFFEGYSSPLGMIVSSIRRNDGYKTNNLFSRGTTKDLEKSIQIMLDLGYIPDRATLQEYGVNLTKKEYNNVKDDLYTFLEKNNTSIKEYGDAINQQNDQSAQEAAFNAYYHDIYSTEAGTTGGDIYNRMVEAEQNAARSNMTLADAQMQQAAMQQASTVKALTDQVKAERMAKLRAGMSEAQIANQDMQTMMTNINALNQQANEMNYAQLQAQQQYNLAQDTAYQQWLDNANAMGQTGAAYAASDAGDVYQQALRIQQRTGMPFAKALKQAQGGN